jgi:hypothetical protein
VGSSKDGEEVAARRAGLPERLAGSYMVVASAGRTEWATFVGLFALNEIPLSADLTWNSYRRSPLGRPDPTMGRQALGRCGMAELKTSDSVVGNEGEGPEWRGESE